MVFNTLTLNQCFWKMKTFFKKLEYRFLVESSKIENTTFLYKTALSKVNVKTNSMGSTKWIYAKERREAATEGILYSGVFLWILRNFYKHLFYRTPSGDCFWMEFFYAVNSLFFWKFWFSVTTSYKELISCTNYPNVYIQTFRKRWSFFIWWCFFPVSILKLVLIFYCFSETMIQRKNVNNLHIITEPYRENKKMKGRNLQALPSINKVTILIIKFQPRFILRIKLLK